MINIRLPDSLGCTVASTGVILSLIKSQCFDEIHVFARHPELVAHIPGIILHDVDNYSQIDLDLREYTARRPHNSKPYRASYLHMLEMAEASFGLTLPIIIPTIHLSVADNSFAIKELSKYKKPVIWFQSKTTSQNRDWSAENWLKLMERLSISFDFIDLSNTEFTLLQSLAITKHSFAGVCLDSFLVHGSAAVGAKNVIVLIGSSRSECMTYPGQKIIYKKSTCIAQPCGMHGYYAGCKKEHEHLFSMNNCLHRNIFACMNKIEISHVEEQIQKLFATTLK